MPRWARILLTGWSFFLFFAGSPLIGAFVFPVMRLFARDRDEHRARCTRILSRGLLLFSRWMRLAGLIGYPESDALPPSLRLDKPFVLVANHPSLIDVVLLLGRYEGLTCVVKGSWYRSVVLGPLLRSTHYLPGPGSGEEESEDMLGTMVEHLQAGHPLLVFPEGTRSLDARLHRFRRGAVEAAVRARVPIVSLFLAIDRPFLMKGVPFWKVPRDRARYTVEVLDVTDTSAVPVEDARALNADVQSRFVERFEQLIASRHDGTPRLPGASATSQAA